MKRVALLAALAAAGCGGGESAELTRAEFTAKAEAICKQLSAELDEVAGEPTSLEELAPVLDQGLGVLEQGIDDLRDLNAPSAMDDEVGYWIGRLELSAKLLAQARDAARDGDQAKVGVALQAGDEANTQANDEARRLGLQECAKD